MSRFPVDEIFWRRTEGNELVSFGRNYEVLLVEAGTEVPLTLWSAEEGGTEIDQPLRTDEEGRALGGGGEHPWAETPNFDVLVNGERIPRRAPEGGGGAVASVNGQTGVVVLDAEDVGAATPADLAAHNADTTAVHGIADTTQLATKGEVAAKQDAATAATDAELAAHEADTTAVHGIADTSKLATKEEVAAKQDAATAATDAELSAHVSDPSAAHDASAISYAGNAGMSASTVEAAIDELASEGEIETFTFNHAAPGAAVIGGFFIRVPPGFTYKLLGARISTISGTCKVKLKRTTSGGATTEPLKEKEAKAEVTEHAASSETLADKDRLLLEVESVSSPTFLIVSVMIEKVRS